MIGVILALILVAVVAGSVVGAVLFRTKKRHNKKLFTVCVCVACVAFAVFMLLPFSVHTVEPGQVAVVKVLGRAEYVRAPGTYLDFWLTREYDVIDTTVQQEQINTMCYSSDAQTMDVTLIVQFQIQKDKALEIDNNYNTLERLTEKVRSVSESNVKTVLSKKSAMNIIETRASVSPDVELMIRETVEDNYYVDIVAVVITNIDFSDAFETAVEEKMVAEQKQLKAEYENQTKVAQAEAEAKAKLVAAEAEAQANELLEQSLTEKILREMYIEKWDGKLPSVVAGDNAASLLIPAFSEGEANAQE